MRPLGGGSFLSWKVHPVNPSLLPPPGVLALHLLTRSSPQGSPRSPADSCPISVWPSAMCMAFPVCAACMTRVWMLLFVLIHFLPDQCSPLHLGNVPGSSGKVLSHFSPSPCPLSLFSARVSMFQRKGWAAVHWASVRSPGLSEIWSKPNLSFSFSFLICGNEIGLLRSWCQASFSVSRSLVLQLSNSGNRRMHTLHSYLLNTSYNAGIVLGAVIKQWTRQPWFYVGGYTLAGLAGKQVNACWCQAVMRMAV